MQMLLVRRLSWLLPLLLAACSADDSQSNQGKQPTNPLGTAGAGQATGGGGFGGPGGNSAGTAGGAGTGGMRMHVDYEPPTPIFMDQCGDTNPAGLNPAQVQMITSAAGTAGTMRWLYPYDQTVFPRGMLAPLMMWEGGAADAVYVHIVSKYFEYKGCLKPTGNGQLQMPQDVWDAAGSRGGGEADPFSVDLTVLTSSLLGQTASGPIHETIMIAPATIKGSVYYNSYSSKLMEGGSASAMPPTDTTTSYGSGSNGMILRIPPKQTAQIFVSGKCVGCHSLSANGSRLLAQTTKQAESYVLTPTTAPNPPAQNSGESGCFGALYPDGSIFVTTAKPQGGGGGDLAHCGRGDESTLVVTDTGAAVGGASVPTNAMMPTFAPNGKMLVWIDAKTSKDVFIADFARGSNAATKARNIYVESGMNMKPSWPFVLPDNKAVIFERTNSSDFTGSGSVASTEYMPPDPDVTGPPSPFGDVYMIDLQSGKSVVLARAMGFATPEDAAADKSNLPFVKGEMHHNFFPTVSPVAAGGYFWVFFDSNRHYGNLGLQRQLWGTAIKVAADGNYSIDQSHPAFYVSGQEFGTGNHRAFTALDPCIADGDSCTSGVDCCSGFCNITGDVGDSGTCGKPIEPRCSKLDEACMTDADCCDIANSCIAGYCGLVIPE